MEMKSLFQPGQAAVRIGCAYNGTNGGELFSAGLNGPLFIMKDFPFFGFDGILYS